MTDARNPQGGYSLLELSVVLVIIALLMGSAITMGVAHINSKQEEVTRMRMAAIEEAMLGFRKAKNRLPIPAQLIADESVPQYASESLGYIMEENNVYHGALPVRDLGLPDEYLYDGWGRKFRYIVSHDSTTKLMDTDLPLTDVNGQGIEMYSISNGEMYNDHSFYVLISHGKNGHGGYMRNGTVKSTGSTNSAELGNCACDSNGGYGFTNNHFTSGDAVETGGANAFDDIVISKTRAQLAGSLE